VIQHAIETGCETFDFGRSTPGEGQTDCSANAYAAADGTVIYAGNELRGFGNLILIKHAGGWTTAYAHNDTLLVANGAQVKRGQVIAKAGSTGNVSSPQLHFELRRGTRAVNPGDYLTAGTDVPSVSRVAGQAAPPGLE